MNKRIFTLLNLLIFVSILILPTLIFLSAVNVAGMVGSIQLANPTQSLMDGKLTVSSILTVSNPGPFDVDASFTVSIKGNQGTQIGVTGPNLVIAAGSQKQGIPVAVEIDLSKVSEDDARRLAFNSENFTIEVSAKASMPPITSVGAEVSAQVAWLPPIYNLTIGTPFVIEANPNQITLEVPVSFENHSPFFAVNGAGVVKLFDSTNQQVGEGTINISAQPKTSWIGSTVIKASPPTNIESLLLNDTTLRYRVESEFTLTDYPVTLSGISQSFELDWGALIRNPKVQTSYTPVNSTHTRITGKLSFTNNNRYLTLDGTITPKMVNALGETWVGDAQRVDALPGSATSLSLEVIVPNSQLLVGGLRLVLGIETAYGSLDLGAVSLG